MSIPEKLYKYKSFEKDKQKTDYLLKSLEDHQIMFSNPGAFNDPFDCQINIRNVGQYKTSLPHYLNVGILTPETESQLSFRIREEYAKGKNEVEVIQAIENEIKSKTGKSMLEDFFEEMEERERSIAKSGILSLTEKNDNLLMWAHYADDHKGICLEFSTSDADEVTRKNFLQDSALTLKVDYGTYYPSLIDIDFPHATDDELKKRLLCYKSTEWAYEQEWRCIIQEGGNVAPFPGKLTGIIFGARVDNDNKNRVLDIVSKYHHKPDIFFSVIREDKFAVDIVKVSI